MQEKYYMQADAQRSSVTSYLHLHLVPLFKSIVTMFLIVVLTWVIMNMKKIEIQTLWQEVRKNNLHLCNG